MDPSKSYYYQGPQDSATYRYTCSYPSTSSRSTIMSTNNIPGHVPRELLDRRIKAANTRYQELERKISEYQETLDSGAPGGKATQTLLDNTKKTLENEAKRDCGYYNAVKALQDAEIKNTEPPAIMKFLRESVEQKEKNMPEHLRLRPKKSDGSAGGAGGNEKVGKTDKDKKDYKQD